MWFFTCDNLVKYDALLLIKLPTVYKEVKIQHVLIRKQPYRSSLKAAYYDPRLRFTLDL